MGMEAKKSEDEFLSRIDITKERWNKLGDSRKLIIEIYNDYKSKLDDFNNVAVSLSGFIQKINGVHSVRWRIKSPEHLIAKICRKKEKGVEKYNDIDVSNYRDKITDIIGVRALHLIKSEFIDIHASIMETWDIGELPVAYVRKGDQQDLRDLYEKLGLSVEDHEDGYRSIHYIILTSFTKKPIKCELQVRTIFEEGWSEIDHKLRYPEFISDPLVVEFINIFNRLSGAADEMGTFVHKLANGIENLRAEKSQKDAEAATHFSALEEKIVELEKAYAQNGSLKAELSQLRGLIKNTKHYEDSYLSLRNHERDLERMKVMQRNAEAEVLAKQKFIDVDAMRRYGFSAESYSKAASLSEKSVQEARDRMRLKGHGLAASSANDKNSQGNKKK
uniref:GTP pyrophosphokinase n=1 Tax=Paracoccus marcusii TaxID=59779 RepID=R4LDD5_9RHOB|nr:GTP pyrophosphokinase [Paracoccus marcusii]AGL12897.1 GTP pyrophosphokinase [Paracoccus marcusii]